MTYLFKLVRRLAISRDAATLPLLALLVACSPDSTAPDGEGASSVTDPIAFEISPRSLTIETNQQVQFRGLTRSRAGDRPVSSIAWKANGGTIQPDGSFSSARTGTFKIFARGRGWRRADSAIVIVVAPEPRVGRIVVSPDPATVKVGETIAFTAKAYRRNGSKVKKLGLKWSAAGGTVDPAGVFTADSVPGSYSVIATNTAGTVADTAKVTVEGTTALPGPPTPPDPGTPVPPTPVPTPPVDTTLVPSPPVPTPPGPPTPAAHPKVILTPASVSLIVGKTKQFKAYGRTASGDSVGIDVTYKVTGGTITKSGLYTAGKQTGTFKVVATSNGAADTSLVTLMPVPAPSPTPTPTPTPTPVPGPTPPPSSPPPSGGKLGIPVGLYGMMGKAGISAGPYNGSVDSYLASNIVGKIAEARANKIRILLQLTGGTHHNYMTNGVFDLAKWEAKMDTYNTPAIKQAIAVGVADGTIIGNSVMDEPANVTKSNNWGPAGTMTKARVDQLCGYVKAMFPTLPTGVVHDYRVLEPEKNYQQCDFIVSQYRLAKQPVQEYRDGALAFGRRSNIAIAFSLNVLHGGTPGTACEKYADDPTGNLCPMTGDQIRSFGMMLGSAGCSLSMWRYERAYYDQPQIQAAVKAVTDSLAKVPRRSCTRR
jgi:hypothetical protein